MSSGSAYKEPPNGSGILAPLATDTDQSYERRTGGSAGNCSDTGNNANDFALIASNPQNLSSLSIPCTVVTNVTSTTPDAV